MAVGLVGLPNMWPVQGVRLGVARAGIKVKDRRDLVLIEVAAGSTAAAVFTQNAFCAAPVTVAKRHLASAEPRYLLINTGFANAGTGERGIQDAIACCDAVASLSGCKPSQVIPFSTGVIGEPLPVARIARAIPEALARCAEDGWVEAAHGIMTTDTVAKGASHQFVVGGKTVTVTGIAKGAGMISPNMATMLAFIATDAAVAPAFLQRCVSDIAAVSFNRITVDGDTSTNDACLVVASGKSGIPLIDAEDGPPAQAFLAALREVCVTLAQAIVRDGEGATKFITVDVQGGANTEECHRAAQAVANSPLVKTAFFASDPNWGRILAALGRAGVLDLCIDEVSVYLDEVCIVRGGARAPDYAEEAGRRVMQRSEITIRIDLARGEANAQVWTCDFSYDYVKINAEYRS
jgi:glutamate N-acetyltransferase/amino-acid N-acetyltransferase